MVAAFYALFACVGQTFMMSPPATEEQFEVTWPVATSDNGYSKYLSAAQLLDALYWRDQLNIPLRQRTKAALLDETQHAEIILVLLKKGNARPVYDPIREETLLTLHPELAPFKLISRIACDVATVKAQEGDLDAASQWLIEADKFAMRIPVGVSIAAFVKQSMLTQLRETTERLLPRFTARQLAAQLPELEDIASRPVSMLAAIGAARACLGRTIPTVINDPSKLGLRQYPPDVAGGVSLVMNALFNVVNAHPELDAVIAEIVRGAPSLYGPTVDEDSVLGYLRASEIRVPTDDREAYRKFVDVIDAAVSPPNYNLSLFAKHMNSVSREHAAVVIESECSGALNSTEAAFLRPEKTWWSEWKPPVEKGAQELEKQDGETQRFARVDLFALRIASVLNQLSTAGTEDTTELCRDLLLEREKARLAVVDARICLYRVANHRLPSSLKAIGSPVDPVGGRPFAYRRTSPTTYELAAVGIPGVGKIDSSTLTPNQSA